MKRTNIVIDEKLAEEGMKLSGAKTLREVVDRALKEMVQRAKRLQMLEMQGCGRWEGDLSELRGDHAANPR